MALLLRTDCLETIEKEQVAKLLYVSLSPICGTSDMSCKMTIFYFYTTCSLAPYQATTSHSIVPKNKHQKEKLGIFERSTKDLEGAL